MKSMLFLLSWWILIPITLHAQDISHSVDNAYLIAKIAGKYHVQPKPIDDTFSRLVFAQLISQIDPNKIFFTQQDISSLKKSEPSIAYDINNRQGVFLSRLISITNRRLDITDSLIHSICQKPFNLFAAQKFTAQEDTTFPTGEEGLRIKLRKYLKATVLEDILDDDSLYSLSASRLKKYVDSLEPTERHMAEYTLTRDNKIGIEGVNGIAGEMGKQYCKAIASTFDPHTEYFPVTEKENFDAAIGQSPMIFGFKFKVNARGSALIEEIAPGSPAFKCGQINKGDRILSIQWENQQPIDVSEASLEQLFEVLSLSNDQKATFRILKPDGTTRTVALYKEKSGDDDDNRVKSFELNGKKKIGFISLPAFYQDWENEQEDVNGCANDVAKEILKLKKDSIDGLILDLRFNGGGSVQEAVELAGIFIDAGPITEFKSREGKVFTLKDVNRGSMYDGPLVILVNGYTASASEIVASALQDYHRAVIIGSPTYGKATAQIVLPLDTSLINSGKDTGTYSGDFLKLTVSEWFRVNGQSIQAKGVQPDIYLPDIAASVPKQEADEPYSLKILPVEPNKYYTPYPPIDIDSLKGLALKYEARSTFFQELKGYNAKMNSRQPTPDIDLNLDEAMKQYQESKSFSESAFVDSVPLYRVENNSFDTQEFSPDEESQHIDDQWKHFLSRDPYLKLAFQVIASMKTQFD